MAMKKSLETGTRLMNLNPDGKLDDMKTFGHFKQKSGSVFPAKKKLVKRLMFDYVLRKFSAFLPLKTSHTKQIFPNPT